MKLDPMQRSRDFTTGQHPRRGHKSTQRQLAEVNTRLTTAFDAFGGGGSSTLILDEITPATPDVVGRIFLQRNNGINDTLQVGITAADGTPILVGLNTQSPDDAAVALSLSEEFDYGSLYTLYGVAIDASANVYTTMEYSGSQMAEKRNSAFVSQWGGAAASGARHLSVDGTNVYVARSSGQRVNKFLVSTGAAGSPASFGTSGTGAGQFQEPYGIASNATHVFVTDRVRNKVIKYTLAGVYVSEFGSTGTADGQFSGLTGITLDLAGNIYVCDTGNNRIQKFDSGGTWLATFGGSAGNGDGQFSVPEGIAVDDTDNMWIADTGNHRVQVLDSTGVYVAKIGNFGSGPAQLKSPVDIALGDGYGLVVDQGNHRISKVRVAGDHTHTNIVTIRSNLNNVLPGTTGGATVSCNADEVCTGGGFSRNSATGLDVYFNFPSGNGWNAFMRNSSAGTQAITVYANCLKVSI